MENERIKMFTLADHINNSFSTFNLTQPEFVVPSKCIFFPKSLPKNVNFIYTHTQKKRKSREYYNSLEKRVNLLRSYIISRLYLISQKT